MSILGGNNYRLKKKPYFIQEPESKVLFSNNSGTSIPCIASGNPKPVIEWMVKGGFLVKNIEGLRAIRQDGSLVFLPFRGEDYRPEIHSTTYYCLASNTLGTVRSRDVTVKAGKIASHYLTIILFTPTGHLYCK